MWMDTLGFGLKALISVIAVAIVLVLLVRGVHAVRRGFGATHGLMVRLLNEELMGVKEMLLSAMTPAKQYRKEYKARSKALADTPVPEKTVFVLDFKGDLMASAVDSLRVEISSVLQVAKQDDEVVVRLESPGGAAHSYGLAASQLARVRSAGIHLTVCVDRVAASGGYMMACVANRIVAAPFAILGSIGVVAPLPNVHRLLDRLGVDFENVTAGEHKRPVSVFGEVTEEGRDKLKEQLAHTHTLFKDLIVEHRPDIDIEKVATGEHWHAREAHALELVDELMTSDDYLLQQIPQANVYHLEYRRPAHLRERVVGALGSAATWLLR